MADGSYHQSRDSPSNKRRDTTIDQTVELTYPNIFLETSFESLLNNSHISNTSSHINMGTTPPQRQPPSLSESWASLSDPELSQEDELRSERTDIGSMVDIRSLDDILSVQEENADTSDEEDDEVALPASHPSNKQHHSQIEPSEHVPTAGTSLTETSLLPAHLVLTEPEEIQHSSEAFVRHILEDFTEIDAKPLGIRESLEPRTGLVGTLRLNLLKSSLRDGGQQALHLLILGKDYFPSLQASIMGKIADALVAPGLASDKIRPHSPSRYHIVPDSFGPGSLPSAAEVIPIDCQLDVDAYQAAEFVDHTHQIIRLRDEASSKRIHSSRHGNRYVINEDKGSKPDLAVIVVSSEDTSADTNRTGIMRIFAQRHSIPVLVISVDNGWGAETHAETQPFGHTNWSAHRCIEFNKVANEPYRRLPLDLDTFLQLDPAQLSRHLAYLVQGPTGSRQKEASHTNSPNPPVLIEGLAMKRPYLATNIPNLQDMRNALSLVHPWLLTSLCIVLLLQVIYLWGGYQPNAHQVAFSDPVAMNTADSPISFSAVFHTSSTTASASSTSAPQAPPLTIEAAKSVAGSFEVEVVGDSDLVIRAPSKPSKNGAITVDVLRNGQALDVGATLLFPDVYRVYIPPEEMYGNLTVRLEMADPCSVDTVTLDLGQQHLKWWLRGVLEKSERILFKKIVQIQHDAQESWQTRDQTFEKFREVGLKLTRRGKDAFQPVRAKVTLLESKVQDWNKRVDALGAEMLSSAKATSADLMSKVMKQVKQMKQTDLPRIALPEVRNPLESLYNAVDHLELGERFQQAADSLHDMVRCETLAIAQDRAQHLGKSWKRNKSGNRGR